MKPTQMGLRKDLRLKKINLVLLALFFTVTALGGLVFGLDFAKGALVGCVVVAINFYLSQYLLARLFLPNQAKVPVVIFYILKFGLSMALLLVSLIFFQIDIWGVMVGLSTLFVVSLFANFFGPSQPMGPQTNENKQS